MKINLIGMILNGAASPEDLTGLIIRDDGSSIDDPAEALDVLFREYANAASGGTSTLVTVPARFMPDWTKHGEYCPKRIASVGDCNCGAKGE